MEPVTPLIKWAQRHDKILLSICVSDLKDEKINLDQKSLTFNGTGGNNVKYACKFNFYQEVVPQESKHKKFGLELFLSIQKKESGGGYWPRLLEAKGKVPYLQVDFNRWKDEDESDEDVDQFNDGLENLMHRMDVGGGSAGNGGGFDPGDEAPDSDDEELPELES
ncbi:PREDICTED: prostaglandin E synthase 3-like [Amphimedon queenslandica]|uniref:CS domain-containing protein n=1 Tax=Amphimedon queenslandica TaxID=400682 RepID=A0A1X7VMF6_AMPQE|nr:PREDICTED: prostaglandin E synthase 3-like [Amphimedon queenslandica]|eukprot:XP_003383733.1 PREDICTED: prostaglandin E synthase 3-like [Amphimedon queenslandica]